MSLLSFLFLLDKIRGGCTGHDETIDDKCRQLHLAKGKDRRKRERKKKIEKKSEKRGKSSFKLKKGTVVIVKRR